MGKQKFWEKRELQKIPSIPLNFTDDLMYDDSSRMNLEGYKTILPPDSLGSASYCIRTMTQNTLPVQSVRLVSYSSFNHICKCLDPTANRPILSLLLQYLWRVLYMYIYIYIYTVGTESIQTPLKFSLFVIYCSHFLKSFKFIFFPH